MLKVIFLGQKKVGEKCFQLLMEEFSSFFSVVGVASNASRDVWWQSRDIFEVARNKNIPFIDNSNKAENEIIELMDQTRPDILFSVQHSWILSPAVLKRVNYNAFNLHNARLPDYKGFNACAHVILNGEKDFSCTLHWLADAVDAGDIAFEGNFKLNPDDTAMSIYDKAEESGFKIFRNLLLNLKDGYNIPRMAINGKGVFYPRNSIKGLNHISDENNFEEVDKKSRAMFFPPFEMAYVKKGHYKFYISHHAGFLNKKEQKFRSNEQMIREVDFSRPPEEVNFLVNNAFISSIEPAYYFLNGKKFFVLPDK